MAMPNNEGNPPPERRVTTQQMEQMTQETQRAVTQATESIHALSTETDRATNLLGFGRRIWVPADEVHVVVGHGMHVSRSNDKSEVFGQSADRPSRYWLNPRTKVIKLKTISFTVPLIGADNMGIEALDANKVSFRLWAHAVAQLNPSKAEFAARRIGQDTKGLVRTITQVAMSQLVEAAATMELGEIIANRQALATKAFSGVNQALAELGYDLSVMTVTQLGGDAYTKLVKQAESRVSKETTITINREQLAEQEDIELRRQREAQLAAETTQRQAATEAVTTEKLVANERAKQKAMLEKVALDRELSQAEAEKAALLKRKEAEYQAELRALEAQRQASLDMERTEAESSRLALEQEKRIQREAALTQAEAERLREQELEQARRAKEVSLLKEQETAEAYELQAQAEANALAIKTGAETRAELSRAEASAKAMQQQASAAKMRAEATRAETAAAGLAEVEVAEAQVAVDEKRVEMQRLEGLAEAEVSKAQAAADAEREEKLREVDINAQKQLANLYEQAPVLVELEKVRMQLDHDLEMAKLQTEASLRAFEAIAPGIKINLIGNGGQMGELLSGVMALSHGLTVVGEDVPAVNRLLHAGENGNGPAVNRLWPHFQTLGPVVQKVVDEMQPRMLAGLTMNDLATRLGPVVSGRESLVSALNAIREDASFRMVGNLPVQTVMGLFGLGEQAEEIGPDEVQNGSPKAAAAD